MLNENVINVLNSSMWDLATCADGEPNVVPVAFKEVTPDGKLAVGDAFLATTLANVKANGGRIAVSAYNAKTLEGYQIKGTATYTTEGTTFDDLKKLAAGMFNGAIKLKGALVITPEKVIVTTPGPDNKKVSSLEQDARENKAHEPRVLSIGGKRNMYKRKLDRDIRCPLEYGMEVFGGKWNSRVLGAKDCLRYSEIRRQMVNITDAVLNSTLKHLMATGMINRTSYDEIPPRVEYSLTDKGRSVIPILQSICHWAGLYYHGDSRNATEQCKKCDYRGV